MVELVLAITILSILALLIAPTLAGVIYWSRVRNDLSNTKLTIETTMAECLKRSSVGRVVVNSADGTVIGEVRQPDATYAEVDRYTLEHASFGRVGATATPWLQSVAATPTTSASDQFTFNSFGIIDSPGGAIFINYKGYDGVIEILESGLVNTFYRGQEDQAWTQ